MDLTNIDVKKIADLCGRWSIRELAVFERQVEDDNGASHDGFGALASFSQDAHVSMLEMGTIEDELGKCLGKPVAVITKWVLDNRYDPQSRQQVLGHAKTIYAAAA